MKQTRHAFTLIELLVVISIIAMLIAILVPSLSMAKEKAREVVCKSNLKQWGVVFTMYYSENKERFMDSNVNSTGGVNQWLDLLSDQYNQSPEGNGKDIAFWNCPSVKSTDGSIHKRGWSMNNINRPNIELASYGINGWLYDLDEQTLRNYYSYFKVDPQDAALFWRTSTSMKNPYEIPMLGECWWIDGWPKRDDMYPADRDDNSYTNTNTYDNEQITRFCLDRHRMKVAFVFADSSVRSVPLKELWDLRWHKGYQPQEPLRWDPVTGWPEWMN